MTQEAASCDSDAFFSGADDETRLAFISADDSLTSLP